MAWVTVWDSPAEASEFYDLLGKVAARRYETTTSSPAGSPVRQYSGLGRTVEIRTEEIGGRPVVTWVDVPAGSPLSVMPMSGIRLAQ